MAQQFYTAFTVQSGQVPSTQTNFPVLLNPTDARFKTTGNGGNVASSSGYDLRPYSDSTLSTALDFELVPGTYSASTGTFEMWVRVPSLSDGYVIYLGYGDTGLTSDGSVTTTWASSFLGVWHMGDGSSLAGDDSSQNNRDGTFTGPVAASGKIGGGANYNDDADTFTIGTAAIPTTGSFSMWVKPNWSQTDGVVHTLGLFVNGGSNLFQTLHYSDNSLYCGWYNGSDGRVVVTSGNYTLNQNQWNKLDLTWDSAGPATKLYLNGTQIGSTNTTNGTWNTAGTTAEINKDTTASYFGTGNVVDEARLSNVVLSANWITTGYNNQNAPGTFYSMGAEQTPGTVRKWIFGSNLLP